MHAALQHPTNKFVFAFGLLYFCPNLYVQKMKEAIYIFIGGGAGSVLRYLAQIGLNERMSGIGFPFSWGTFAVNIIGSFFIGLFYSVSERWSLPMEMRLFLTTGPVSYTHLTLPTTHQV